MKKIISLVVYLALLVLFISCAAGYVESEPTYVEIYRPAPPAPNYIWIEGNWVWSNNTYVYRNGYWAKPRPNAVYISGYWKKEPKG